MYKIFEKVDKTLIINLDKDKYRKSHAQEEIENKSQNYEFIKAISHNDDIVKDIYKQNKVFSYPPCFRCKVCLLYTSPSPRDGTKSRMPSSA